MGYKPSPDQGADALPPASGRRPPLPVKIVVSGGFGVGKTTTVGSISEITPLTTEGLMTSLGAETDDTSRTPGKTTTTVAMDFGRLSIDSELTLYLFGTPGQDRFGFMWRDIAEGALGALVIVDTGRLADCYPSIDYFEQLSLPYVVAVNRFDGAPVLDADAIRWALAVGDDIGIVSFDARDKLSVRDALVAVLRTALRHSVPGGRAISPAGHG